MSWRAITNVAEYFWSSRSRQMASSSFETAGFICLTMISDDVGIKDPERPLRVVRRSAFGAARLGSEGLGEARMSSAEGCWHR
jgi:hypothetical protein